MRIALIDNFGHQSVVLRSVEAVEGTEITGLVGFNEEYLENLRKRCPRAAKEAKLYRDLKALLNDGNFDIASICTRFGEHTLPILLCAENGKHIIVEKPVVTELADLEEVRQKVKAAGVQLTAMLPMRYGRAYRKAKEVVDEGTIGEVLHMWSQKSYKYGTRSDWMQRREFYGGTIPWVGIHAFDYMRWTSGREYKAVAAFHGTVGNPTGGELEMVSGVSFQLDNGGTALTSIDYLNPDAAPSHGDDRLRLAGTLGTVEVYDFGSKARLITKDEPPKELDLPDEDRNGFLRDFLLRIEDGQDIGISADDSFWLTEVSIKARTSADEGRVIPLIKPPAAE
jgi:predicted dehydrogenase